MSQDEAALLMLDSARRAYNERNLGFAVERFREFLQKFGGHREAVSAYYGLALALLDAPQKDYKAITEALQQVAGRQEFPDRPVALYYMGTVARDVGTRTLAEAEAKPNEATQLRNQARERFDEAGRYFSEAAGAFSARAKASAAPAGGLHPDLEWAARSRCDQCEMLLRAGRSKEAGDLASAVLADPLLSKSRWRGLATYQVGYALFTQKDYQGAGRALSQLAPFKQEFGVHARYLLARVHHLCGERPEAAAGYKAALAGYDEQKKAAQQALQNPGALKPEQKTFFETLVNSPPPEYLPRTLFYLSLLAAEEGRFAEAAGGFAAIVQQYPKFPLMTETQLRLGYCQLQLRNFPEAVKFLQPLAEHPQLGDQALWWLARCQVGAADPNNAPAFEQAVRGAMDLMRRAAERAGQLANNDPDARTRRADIQLDLADTMQLVKMYKEAAATYQTVMGEGANPDRAQEALQRQVTAYHLGGMYRESDEAAQRFVAAYPKSTLLPAVLFRSAENAFAVAAAAAAKPDLQNRQQELERLFGDAIARYQRLLDRYPEFQYANLARHGMATAYYQLGRYAEAIAVLERIPDADRNGDLAIVPYVLADCLIRTLPSEADDALQAAQVSDQAGRAARLLENFVASQPKVPQTPDAFIKLGSCYQRIAALLADPAEQRKAVETAHGAYERFLQQFPQDPLMPTAVFERAKCRAMLGDLGGAVGELNRFLGDPFKNSPIAPLALLRSGALQRAQNRAAEAVKVLEQARAQHEEALLKDPARSAWVPMLHYEQALGLKESGKLPDARALFEALATKFPGSPEATNAVWRAAQCRREELTGILAAARAAMVKQGAKPEEIAAARNAMEEGLRGVGQTLDALQLQADDLGKKAAGSEAHLRILYEAAWCYRALADIELEAARQKLQREAVAEAHARLAKRLPAGQPPLDLRPPDIPLSKIAMRLTESTARDYYRRLIEAAPTAPLALHARLELAEMHAQRGDHDRAISLLTEAMEKGPAADLGEQIKLRLASELLAKGSPKAAMLLAEAIAKNINHPRAPQARYVVGEAHAQLKEWPKAVELLVPFRDHGPFQNIPDLTDRALLRLGQAYAQMSQWDPSRQAFEQLVGRFPQGPWADEGRYGMGWAWQSQKQLDNAVNAYNEVVRRTAAEVAAKAQLQIGLCRLEQKRHPEAIQALLAVPLTYNYPEWSAAALCEAARAYMELRQPAEAAKLWRQVVKDYSTSPWARVAQQGLAGLK
jgi:TolA-binding protein